MFELFTDSLPAFLDGMQITLIITVCALFFATIIGLVLGLINIGNNTFLRAIAKVYIDIVRGTPLIVQAFFLYFGMTGYLGFHMTAEVAGTIVISINAGAYMAEIFRGGIKAIDVGQMEAARSLGLPYTKAMIKVVLPQAFRNMIPAILNQFIISLKDTSILTVIGVNELTQSGQIIISSTYRSFEVWTMVGIMYFILIFILTTIFRRIEARMSND
ncbi:amino acid ABC transporter permease [Vibrio sp. UCD-FRSSP16_10]|uniref:amino acid ABC transporter permease n=1 Tax=unclassified Vibrio TaxID=2614977 RepID=UPI0007FF32EF|nr:MULTISPECIES: amino acid ABC transporter permease [unclassified Vibrio]OBT09417.1 amino acid ABC transporter permease [Vibrio sp. UCD-FRSSP16_30]OBT22096.1 amino acid ABC transporter permease [Vibrio sp. UCD-FRSSP16_10]